MALSLAHRCFCLMGAPSSWAATGNTAYYSPLSNTWAPGPTIPDGLVCGDGPAAMLPNGDVLLAASPSSGNGPTRIFQLDPVTNNFTDVTPTNIDLSTDDFELTMLVLPTGQVLLINQAEDTVPLQIDVYTPTGSPNAAWKPAITGVTNNGDYFTLSGTQLNGISEGASYGDDNSMASNYPIVQLTDQSGKVSYARTVDWSSTQVATGSTPESVQFTLPANFIPGIYGVTVIANGIASVQENLSVPVRATIGAAMPNSADAAIVSFPINFSNPVTGVTADGFTLLTSSGITGGVDHQCNSRRRI